MKIGDIIIDGNVFLAPMAGVTDNAFRKICVDYGCDMTYTEMVSSKALYYNDKKTMKLLTNATPDRPFAVQIFGSEPEIMAQTAYKALSTGASILDINMGCPVPKVADHGEGSALMKNPELAGKIVYEVSRASTVPVTVKIRKGWDDSSVNAVEVALAAQENGAAAVCVHGRTREQYYTGKADWDIIAEVKEKLNVPVIGNGDIFTCDDAKNMLDYTKCDAIMVARGAQGNPFLFKQIKNILTDGKNTYIPDISEKTDTLLKQIDLMVQEKGEYIAVREARKHAAWYLKGEKHSSKVRGQINYIESVSELKTILSQLIN